MQSIRTHLLDLFPGVFLELLGHVNSSLECMFEKGRS
jgi:hypothetical protein